MRRTAKAGEALRKGNSCDLFAVGPEVAFGRSTYIRPDSLYLTEKFILSLHVSSAVAPWSDEFSPADPDAPRVLGTAGLSDVALTGLTGGAGWSP